MTKGSFVRGGKFMFILDMVTCGGLGNFDKMIPSFTVLAVNAIKVVVPILLIVFGMLDLAKAVMSNDEKEMKGAQGKFIKRAIYAVIVFFIVAIVQLVFNTLGNAEQNSDEDGSSENAAKCITCFISNADKCTPADE